MKKKPSAEPTSPKLIGYLGNLNANKKLAKKFKFDRQLQLFFFFFWQSP
jgi:hypothetical protein